MNQKIKERWLAALRSGEYKQGSLALRRFGSEGRQDTYCCLGVLCEIAVADGIVERKGPSFTGVYAYGNRDESESTSYLPASVAQWAGLNSITPSVANGYLSSHNDTGSSFDKIADMIEVQL